jgi:hypothetical protein
MRRVQPQGTSELCSGEAGHMVLPMGSRHQAAGGTHQPHSLCRASAVYTST